MIFEIGDKVQLSNEAIIDAKRFSNDNDWKEKPISMYVNYKNETFTIIGIEGSTIIVTDSSGNIPPPINIKYFKKPK